MEPIKKILAPTDLSKLSLAGVRYALDLARTLDASVTIYHVVNREEIMHYAEHFKYVGVSTGLREVPDILKRYEAALARFLDENLADVLPLVEVRRKVEMGVPHKSIAEQAKLDGADLIVISTHGRTGLSHVILGSVTEKVVRIASCPVISIHPPQDAKTAEIAAAVG